MLIFAEQMYQKMGQELIVFGIMKNWFGKDYAWNFGENDQEIKNWSLEKKWLCVLINIEDNDISAILERLKLTKIMVKNTLDYMTIRYKLRNADNNIEKIYEALFDVKNLIIDILKKHDDLQPIIEKYYQFFNNHKMTVRGTDLLALGIEEGPEIGRILRDIQLGWLTGKINNREEENNYIRQITAVSSEGSI
jgi:tRNA nucleotidyltransferase (CCA-adding enzyme)